MTVDEFLTILFSMQPAMAQYYGGKSGCMWQEDNVRAHMNEMANSGRSKASEKNSDESRLRNR